MNNEYDIKLICIKKNVLQKDKLIKSLKDDVVLIDKSAKLILDKCSGNQHLLLGLVWTNTSNSHHINFFNNNVEKKEINKDNKKNISLGLVNLLKQLYEKNVRVTLDLITCNLRSNKFKKEIKELEDNIEGLNIRYSVNITGNNPRGDWVMESDNTNIKDLYFTDNIKNYTGQLDGKIIISDKCDLPSEIKYNKRTKTLYLVNNLKITDTESNFLYKLLPYETFDGCGYKIIVSKESIESGFSSLFTVSKCVLGKENNILFCEDGTPTIINIKVNWEGNMEENGCIADNETQYLNVCGCSVNIEGDIFDDGGGLIGEYAAFSAGIITVDDCEVIVKGNIYDDSGGLFSDNACEDKGIITVNNCKVIVKGDVYNDSGALFGNDAGENRGNITVSNCKVIVKGDVYNDSGGLFGNYAGYANGTITVSNCIVNVNNDVYDESSGLFGYQAGAYGGTIDVSCCTVTIGNKINDESGGLFSDEASAYGGIVTVKYCKVNIENDICDNSAGLFANYAGFGGGVIKVLNCQVNVNGNIISTSSDNSSGGLFAEYAGQYAGIITVLNCTITIKGDIISENENGCGGIFASNMDDSGSIIKIKQCCVTVGNINGNSGGILGSINDSEENIKNSKIEIIDSTVDVHNSIKNESGGITGSFSSTENNSENGVLKIENCNINIYENVFKNSGGILGPTLKSPNRIITFVNNCKVYIGGNVCTYSGGVFGTVDDIDCSNLDNIDKCKRKLVISDINIIIKNSIKNNSGGIGGTILDPKDNLLIKILCCTVYVNSIENSSKGLLDDAKYNKIKVCNSHIEMLCCLI